MHSQQAETKFWNEPQLFKCLACLDSGLVMEDGTDFPREMRGDRVYPTFPPMTVYAKCACQGAVEYKRRVDKSGLKDTIDRCTFDNYIVYDKATKIKKEKAIKFISQTKYPFFLYLGLTGAGKTHLCAAMLNKFAENGRSIQFASYLKLSRELKTLVNDREYNDLFYKYANADVFYLDDLFKGHHTEADRSHMQELIDHRNSRRLTTLISSEMSIGEILSLDEAFGSRLGELAGSEFNLDTDGMVNYRIRR